MPLGFYVVNDGVDREAASLEQELVALVRQKIGAVAAFKTAIAVKRLPKTRSGKVLRGTMQKIADRQDFKMPARDRRSGHSCRDRGYVEKQGTVVMIERFETGRRMSKIVKHNGVAYLCGQVGDGDTVAEQTRDCLARIDALLDQAGSDREHILQATIWLADMADFSEMNARLGCLGAGRSRTGARLW